MPTVGSLFAGMVAGRAAALRLIHSHFRKPDGARCTIPRDPMDDDVVICDYINEQEEKEWNNEPQQRP